MHRRRRAVGCPTRRTRPFAAARASIAAALFMAAMLAGVFARTAHAAGKDLEGVVNLNTASDDLLELLPGVGPAKVRNIVWYRRRHPFRTVDELVRIKGIGRKMVRNLRPHLAVSGPSTAQALRRARGAEPSVLPPVLPPPRPPPPAIKTAGCRPAAPVMAPARERARAAAVGERASRSPANHCAGAR